MEKAKLPREVAEAIEKLQLKWENKAILQLRNYELNTHDEALLIRDYFKLPETEGFNKLTIALYIGYEVEQTPEKLLLEVFNKGLSITDSSIKERVNGAFRLGIQNAATILGHKIEGVNV